MGKVLSLYEQLDEILKDFVSEVNLHLVSSDEVMRTEVGKEAKQAIKQLILEARIDALRYLTVDAHGQMYRQNVPIETYKKQLRAVIEEKK